MGHGGASRKSPNWRKPSYRLIFSMGHGGASRKSPNWRKPYYRLTFSMGHGGASRNAPNWRKPSYRLTFSMGHGGASRKWETLIQRLSRPIPAPLLTPDRALAGFLHHSRQLFCHGDRKTDLWAFSGSSLRLRISSIMFSDWSICTNFGSCRTYRQERGHLSNSPPSLIPTKLVTAVFPFSDQAPITEEVFEFACRMAWSTSIQSREAFHINQGITGISVTLTRLIR